jgi:hypothetical protein
VERLQIVACDQPHDLQRFATGRLSDDDAGAVETVVDDQCEVAFGAFVGSEVGDSELDVARTRPSADTWNDGDRAFYCYLGIEGARLIGNARSTGW